MRNIKIYNLIFKRTARFAPESYDIYNDRGKAVAELSLESGLLTLRISSPTKFVYKWEISDLNMFHSMERREKWLKISAEKYMEVHEKYGKKTDSRPR